MKGKHLFSTTLEAVKHPLCSQPVLFCGEQSMRSTAMPNNIQAELAQPQPQKGVGAKCSMAASPKMFTFRQ
jgi:hypothetical protein